MKNALIPFLLLLAAVPMTYAEDAAVSEEPIMNLYDSAPILTATKTEEPMMCTMEYRPVCGVDGKTYGNACSAGKVSVAYDGECDSYVDAKAYAKLVRSKSYSLKRQLAKYSDAQILAAIPNIEKRIEAVKLSKIVREAQVEKITFYTFVKNSIPAILEARAKQVKGKMPAGSPVIIYSDGMMK